MSLKVRVVAPTGRDAELIVGVLRRHDIIAEWHTNALDPLDAANNEPLGPLLLAEECLTSAVLARLASLVHNQPAWSDFPILILTRPTSTQMRGRQIEDQHTMLGSPVLLERPIRTETLVSSVRAAVRARKRQYEVRDALLARDAAFAELRTERDTLSASEERFRRLIETASVGINISDTHGNVFYGNPTLLRLIGYTAEDVENGLVHWDQLTPPEFAEADRRATAQLLATGTCEPYQKAYRAHDGSLIPVLVGMTLLSRHPTEQVAVFLTDLTPQKRAETALIQSEKLAAVGRLAASISHEINNPLEAVTNLLFLTRHASGVSAEAQQFLASAELELARVSQIATHTLRFHRQSSRPTAVSPADLIESVVGLYHGRLSNADIHVSYSHGPSTPFLCYEGDIRQVINNLVSNAIDAMRNGGKILIRTRDCTFWRNGCPAVRITIADTGHGMPPSVRKRIFDAFYTTKDMNGTGLGLWISKGIVEKHFGLLEVKSFSTPPCTGSVFSIVLPRTPVPIHAH